MKSLHDGFHDPGSRRTLAVSGSIGRPIGDPREMIVFSCTGEASSQRQGCRAENPPPGFSSSAPRDGIPISASMKTNGRRKSRRASEPECRSFQSSPLIALTRIGRQSASPVAQPHPYSSRGCEEVDPRSRAARLYWSKNWHVRSNPTASSSGGPGERR
jgi:hypothetical protein